MRAVRDPLLRRRRGAAGAIAPGVRPAVRTRRDRSRTGRIRRVRPWPARRISCFPSNSGIIDVTAAPYNAQGDGKTDDTRAIQQALRDYADKGVIIYLPNGTYLISKTLRWGTNQKLTTLQGQSRAGTILRLKDACPGFTDPAQPGRDGLDGRHAGPAVPQPDPQLHLGHRQGQPRRDRRAVQRQQLRLPARCGHPLGRRHGRDRPGPQLHRRLRPVLRQERERRGLRHGHRHQARRQQRGVRERHTPRAAEVRLAQQRTSDHGPQSGERERRDGLLPGAMGRLPDVDRCQTDRDRRGLWTAGHSPGGRRHVGPQCRGAGLRQRDRQGDGGPARDRARAARR